MDLLEYIGHLHPVVVHLPIGILLTAILFEWLSGRKGFKGLRKSGKVLLTLGFASAVVAGITGYILSLSGDYDAGLLRQHQWLGISVALLSLVILLLHKPKQRETRLAYRVLMPALGILIILAGHAGGSLTHGADFLRPPSPSEWFGADATAEFPTTNLNGAVVYTDLIAPVFKAKCIRCHGASRQKGKLRLDQPEYILKGGKDGAVIDTLKGEESELFKRIHLAPEDEDHMPPKEKAQLSRKEIAILSYWIKTGADFKAKLGTLPGADSIASLLTDPANDVPGMETDAEPEFVPMPDQGLVESLRSGGVAVSFLSQGNGALMLNFMNADTTRFSSLLTDASRMQRQIVEMKFTGCRLSHADWSQLSALTSLLQLNLENANLTDQDLRGISSLSRLRYLNLVGNGITLEGLSRLKTLPALKRLFLFRTQINESEHEQIKQLFPRTLIDFGSYQVPTLISDTTLVTKPYTIPK